MGVQVYDRGNENNDKNGRQVRFNSVHGNSHRGIAIGVATTVAICGKELADRHVADEKLTDFHRGWEHQYDEGHYGVCRSCHGRAHAAVQVACVRQQWHPLEDRTLHSRHPQEIGVAIDQHKDYSRNETI